MVLHVGHLFHSLQRNMNSPSFRDMPMYLIDSGLFPLVSCFPAPSAIQVHINYCQGYHARWVQFLLHSAAVVKSFCFPLLPTR
jgi:hypothetical protein